MSEPSVLRDCPTSHRHCSSDGVQVSEGIRRLTKSVVWIEGGEVDLEVVLEPVEQCGVNRNVSLETAELIWPVVLTLEGDRDKDQGGLDSLLRGNALCPFQDPQAQVERVDALFVQCGSGIRP